MKIFRVIYGLILYLLLTPISAQELPKNLVYANENMVFENLYILGDYKLLHFSDERRQNKRFVYLLDKGNIVRDTLKVFGNDRFLLKTDSTFSIRGLGENVNLLIQDNLIKATSGFVSKSKFNSEILRPIFVLDQLFGSVWLPEDQLNIYKRIEFDQFLTDAIPSPREKEYNLEDLDTLYIFNENTVFLKDKEVLAKENITKTVLDKEAVCCPRLSNYYSWNSYSLFQNSLFMYERRKGSLFELDIKNNFEVTRELVLPISDAKTEGWKYLFDFKLKKHYAVKRIDVTEIPEGLKKRKARKIEKEYKYELYELVPRKDTFELKPLYNLPFDPVLVDNDLVYEIIQESKKGSAIFFHPLDPNYKYEKSTYLDYGG